MLRLRARGGAARDTFDVQLQGKEETVFLAV